MNHPHTNLPSSRYITSHRHAQALEQFRMRMDERQRQAIARGQTVEKRGAIHG